MDHIVTTTLALKQRRLSRVTTRRESFQRWVDSLNPQLYVFYRVNGPDEFKVNSRVQIKLNLMPCLLVQNTAQLCPIFEKPFVLNAFIDRVQPQDDDWVSVDAHIGRYPRQIINTCFPPEYFDQQDKILGKIAMPDNVVATAKGSDTPEFGSISKLRFYHFHLSYHLSTTYDKRYGLIDRMWSRDGVELALNLPPGLEPKIEPRPETNDGSPIIQPSSTTNELTGLFDSFLSSQKLSASLKTTSSSFYAPVR